MALGVVLALALTALIAAAGLPAWWVLPIAALALLALSVRAAGGDVSANGSAESLL